MVENGRSKNLKKTLVASALALTLAGAAIPILSGTFNKNEKDEINLKSGLARIDTTGDMYDVMLEYASSIKLPTLFDNKDNPIQSVSISSFVGEDGNPKEDTDLMLNVVYQNKDNNQTYGYTVLSDPSEYEFAKEHGKLAEVENERVVYIHEGNYYWQDKDNELYSSLAAYDYEGEGPDVKELDELLLSMGKSKHDIRSYFTFKDGKDLVIPKYTINSKSLPYSMVLDYTAETKDEQASSIVAMHYSDFIITASQTNDFTLSANLTSGKEEIKQELFNDRIIYIDNKSNLLYYTGDDTSVIIQSNLGDKTTGELIKVLKSMKFNTL